MIWWFPAAVFPCKSHYPHPPHSYFHFFSSSTILLHKLRLGQALNVGLAVLTFAHTLLSLTFLLSVLPTKTSIYVGLFHHMPVLVDLELAAISRWVVEGGHGD
jgi:hypothetical protein